MVLPLLALPLVAGAAASHAAAGSFALAGAAAPLVVGHVAGHALAGSFAAVGPWAGAHVATAGAAPWAVAGPWAATGSWGAGQTAFWGANAFNWGLGLGLVGAGLVGLGVGAAIGYAARPRPYYAPYY